MLKSQEDYTVPLTLTNYKALVTPSDASEL